MLIGRVIFVFGGVLNMTIFLKWKIHMDYIIKYRTSLDVYGVCESLSKILLGNDGKE